MKKKIFLLIIGVVLVLSFALIYFSAEVSYGVQEKFTLRDFNFRTTQGELISLSHIQTDFIYIECWATWCPNCIKEHAFLNKQYNKLNNVAVVSISLDKDSFHHEKALQAALFQSYYSISDTLEWKSDYVSQFKFEDLSFNLLLNRERVIIGRNIEAEQLLKLTGNN